MRLLLILVLTLSLAAATPVKLQVDAVLVSPINTTKIIDYVNSAKKAIYMEVYVFTYKPLADALVAAARRGVDVYVVLSSRVFGGVPQEARDIAKYLEENGVKVVWNRDFPNVHTKLYVIDNRTVIIGNINPTRSGFLRNKGVMLVINNSTLARQLATVVLNDFHGRYPRYNFPGVLISPINSQAGLEWILSQPGTLYIAMEQIYVDSGLVPYILKYPEYYAVVARTDADIKTVFDDSLVAKIIVVGDYVYVGSINIGYYSIQRNREVGLLIHNPDLAHRMRTLILQWYREAGGEVGQVGVSTTDVGRGEVYDIQSLGVLTWIAIFLAILLAVLRRVGGRR